MHPRSIRYGLKSNHHGRWFEMQVFNRCEYIHFSNTHSQSLFSWSVTTPIVCWNTCTWSGNRSLPLFFLPHAKCTKQFQVHYHPPLGWSRANSNLHVAGNTEMDCKQICDVANRVWMWPRVNKCIKITLGRNLIMKHVKIMAPKFTLCKCVVCNLINS